MLLIILWLLLFLSQNHKQRSKKHLFLCATCSSTTSCYSYPWKWWHTAKWGRKVPTHFDYLAILKTLLLRCGGAPLLHIFKPGYISHKYRKSHLKAFCNRLAISVKVLPLSHQKVCTSCHLCSGFPTATLQAIQKGYFLRPPLLQISASDVCSVPPCLFHTDEESWKQYGHQISSWFWKQNSSSLL